MHQDAMNYQGTWRNQREPEVYSGLTCQIEMDNRDGGTRWEVAATTASVLRTLAAQIEAGALSHGVYPVYAADGEKIGKLYLDWYSTR